MDRKTVRFVVTKYGDRITTMHRVQLYDAFPAQELKRECCRFEVNLEGSHTHAFDLLMALWKEGMDFSIENAVYAAWSDNGAGQRRYILFHGNAMRVTAEFGSGSLTGFSAAHAAAFEAEAAFKLLSQNPLTQAAVEGVVLQIAAEAYKARLATRN